MIDDVSPYTITRTALVGVEWIFAIAIVGVIGDFVNEFTRAFNLPGYIGFLLAWAILGWLALSYLLVMHILHYSTKIKFSAFIEMIVQSVLCGAIWFIGAIVAVAKLSGDGFWETKRNATMALYWLNFGMSAASVVMSWLDTRACSSSGGGADVEGGKGEDI